ncbi:DUF421 domain-containing protein [Brevibacillus daliensis]|uniref:DUF421 domain-containing protein n=1 Tax=Brevibacillus daliensis TaxID=2892995 RepID=UPI001E6138DE|nr:DUF421 domain-containing protein [Brevibacillus daliensis]
MELVTILLRTLFSYFFLLLLMRIMGKREVGQMSPFDIVISIMFAEMAVLAIDQTDRPLVHLLSPMVLLAILEIGLSYTLMKSKKFRNFISGHSDVLIEDGKINEEALRSNRLNLDDLLLQLRQSNIKNLADVEFAILETTGKVSAFTKKVESPVTMKELGLKPRKPVIEEIAAKLPLPLIMDGKVQENALDKIGKNHLWLKRELKKMGVNKYQQVFFCSVDEYGKLYIDLMEKKPRK